MKNLHRTICIVTLLSVAGTAFAAPLESSRGQKLFRYSRTTERERPQLNEETRRLISEYRRNPSEENKAALRKQIEKNYDAVIARKKAKLEELKKTARHDFKIREMEKIVDEVVQDRERRIEQSMRRFTDPRLRPGSRRNTGGFLRSIIAGFVIVAWTEVIDDGDRFLAVGIHVVNNRTTDVVSGYNDNSCEKRNKELPDLALGGKAAFFHSFCSL